jgi:hypothetical protein
MKQWFSDMQKELHVLGPLLPPGYGTETQSSEAGSSPDIATFLEEMLVQHGKKSVFFVSFVFPAFQLNKFIYLFSSRFPLALSFIPQIRITLMS